MEAKEIIALSSAIIALAAFFLTLQADKRARDLALTQMFLALRSRFLDVYRQLPPADTDASNYSEEQKAAVLAYWHHSFDEWYITNYLGRKYMKKLWDDFYAPAVLSGMRHPGYRQILFEIIDTQENLSEYQLGYGKAIKKLWADQKGVSVS